MPLEVALSPAGRWGLLRVRGWESPAPGQSSSLSQGIRSLHETTGKPFACWGRFTTGLRGCSYPAAPGSISRLQISPWFGSCCDLAGSILRILLCFYLAEGRLVVDPVWAGLVLELATEFRLGINQYEQPEFPPHRCFPLLIPLAVISMYPTVSHSIPIHTGQEFSVMGESSRPSLTAR